VRRAAVAVDSVVGLRKLDLREAGELPPLLRAAGAEMIDAIGTCDAQLLIVLRAMRIIPDEVWARLEAGEGRP
jgi:purine-binding chemotaxis protein CheW